MINKWHLSPCYLLLTKARGSNLGEKTNDGQLPVNSPTLIGELKPMKMTMARQRPLQAAEVKLCFVCFWGKTEVLKS